MDMRQYASTYVKPDNVRDGPIQTRIANLFESEQTGRPVLELETGSQFTLNDSNTNTLIKAWGYKSEDWIGQELELFLGTYKDWKSDPPTDKETVKVRAISPAKTPTADGGAPTVSKLLPRASRPGAAGGPPKRDDMDDSIPWLKRAREIACHLVGADPTTAPVCHPLRWPGSWHRKAEPRPCEIVAGASSFDHEIDLDAALKALEPFAPLQCRRTPTARRVRAPTGTSMSATSCAASCCISRLPS
jgi:hypothetical protein